MKKLVLFLSLCVTNIVYGDINEILERIDNMTQVAFLANAESAVAAIMNEAKTIASLNFNEGDNPLVLTEQEVEHIRNLVKTIIEHIGKMKGVVLKYKLIKEGQKNSSTNYDTLFNQDLNPFTGTETSEEWFLDNHLKDFHGTENAKEHTKVVLRAFYTSLYVNYHFFINLPKDESLCILDHYYNYAIGIVKYIYSSKVKLDQSSKDVILGSFLEIFQKLPIQDEDRANIAKEFELRFFDHLEVHEPNNAPQKNNGEKEQETKPSSWKNFPSKKVIGRTTAVLVAVGGSYYVVEKTKYGKRLKKFEQENPNTAKALKVLAGIVVGGVLYTLNK